MVRVKIGLWKELYYPIRNTITNDWYTDLVYRGIKDIIWGGVAVVVRHDYTRAIINKLRW